MSKEYAQALYDYEKQHTDELSFKKGDVILLSNELDGGWWEGVLKNVTGWFPSNYVVKLGDNSSADEPNILDQFASFQRDIILHIIEGEVRQRNELISVTSDFLSILEAQSHLKFLDKVPKVRDLLRMVVNFHQNIVTSLESMKNSPSEPYHVGKLFLEHFQLISSVVLEYARVHMYVVAGIDTNLSVLEQQNVNFRQASFVEKAKQQLFLPFDRLGRYSCLLKEMDRYLEPEHEDRADLHTAAQQYSELSDHCLLLRKFKERDMDVLCATIEHWVGPPLETLGDPIFTLKLLVRDIQPPSAVRFPERIKNSVLVLFESAILLLGTPESGDAFIFQLRAPIESVGLEESPSATASDAILTLSLPDQTVRLNVTSQDAENRDLLFTTMKQLSDYSQEPDKAQVRLRASRQLSPEARPGIPSRILNRFSCVTGNTRTIPPRERGPQFPRDDSAIHLQSSCLMKEQQQQQHPVAAASGRDTPTAALQQQKRRSFQQQPFMPRGDKRPNEEAMAPRMPARRQQMPKSPSLSTGPPAFALFPHTSNLRAHVQWPSLTSEAWQSGAEEEEEAAAAVASGFIRKLHLDTANSELSGSDDSRRNSSMPPGGSHMHGPAGLLLPGMAVSESAVPPPPREKMRHASGLDGSASVASRDTDRKRSGRQKSAISAEDVLKSRTRIDEAEQRAKSDMLILQVVEAYCRNSASNPKSIGLGNLRLMDAKSKAMLAQHMMQGAAGQRMLYRPVYGHAQLMPLHSNPNLFPRRMLMRPQVMGQPRFVGHAVPSVNLGRRHL